MGIGQGQFRLVPVLLFWVLHLVSIDSSAKATPPPAFWMATVVSQMGAAWNWFEYLGAPDVDGDGNTDLVYMDGNMIWTYLGLGDGTFDPLPDLTFDPELQGSMSSPSASLFVDMDGDGDEDLVLCAMGSSGDARTPRLWILPNSGKRIDSWELMSFEMPRQFSILAPVRGAAGVGFVAATATFPEEGGIGTEIHHIPSAGPLALGEAREVLALQDCLPVYVGDVDGDGIVDVVVHTYRKPDPSCCAVHVLYGDGSGGYTEGWPAASVQSAELQPNDESAAYWTSEEIQSAVCGDVNEDGHTDAAIWTETGVYVALWDSGRFSVVGQYAERAGFPYLVDVDGDKHLDLITRNSLWVSIRLGDGHGAFGPVVSEFALEHDGSLHWVDIDGDGRTDIANEGHYYTTIHLNCGEPWGASRIPYHGALPIDVSDLDRDGDLDLLTTGLDGIEVLSNEGSGAFLCRAWPWSLDEVGFGGWGPVASTTTRTATYVLGEANVARELWEGVPDEVPMKVWALPFLDAVPTAWQADPQTLPILVQGDLDGDSEDDIAWAQPSSLTVLWSGSDRVDYPWPYGEIGLLAAGDVDGEGQRELAVIAYAESSSLVLAHLTGRALDVSLPRMSLPMIPQAIALGDLDQDRLDDVVVAGLMLSASGDVEDPEIAIDRVRLDVHLSTGETRTFEPEKFPEGDALWSYGALALGDLTHDGVLDLALSSVSGAGVLILPGRGDGSFDPGFMIPVPVGPVWIRDLDGNGKAELISAVQESEGAAWIWWNGGPE